MYKNVLIYIIASEILTPKLNKFLYIHNYLFMKKNINITYKIVMKKKRNDEELLVDL